MRQSQLTKKEKQTCEVSKNYCQISVSQLHIYLYKKKKMKLKTKVNDTTLLYKDTTYNEQSLTLSLYIKN